MQLRRVLALTLLFTVGGSPGALATKLGVMGDSLSDEYLEASYGSYAENWVEQLVMHAGIDVGPLAGGNWGEPRRSGYEYNWARAGADSVSLLSEGQDTGLAAQVGPQAIGLAVLMIGANDFNPTNANLAYINIYFGVWGATQIDAHVAGIVANIETALDTVLATGARVVLVNVPDYGITPAVRDAFRDPVGRQRVSDAISQLNTNLLIVAQARALVVADLFTATEAIFGSHASPVTSLLLGNVIIDLGQNDTAGGGNPTAGFVHDGVHPNTTLQGILANTFMEAMNIGYGANLQLFSEQEILAHRGIAYGGADTLMAQIGQYSDYIISFVPACSDNQDNNSNGLIDMADPGCFSPMDPSENVSRRCGFGGEVVLFLAPLLWSRRFLGRRRLPE